MLRVVLSSLEAQLDRRSCISLQEFHTDAVICRLNLLGEVGEYWVVHQWLSTSYESLSFQHWRYINILKNIDIDKDNLENIVIDIDKDYLDIYKDI